MKIALELMNACNATHIPRQTDLLQWLTTTLKILQADKTISETNSAAPLIADQPILEGKCSVELSIRIVDETESQQLNLLYRGKDKPTNILSFPCQLQQRIEPHLLGDLVICADIVNREAHQQYKLTEHHWAHILIHGILHLLEFNHIEGHDAAIMESLEVVVLHELGISNPYYLTQGLNE